MLSFKEKWLAAVENKNSILCAGLDPAEFAMGRTEKGEGLPKAANKRDWAIKYIEAVAPYCAAIKPNIQYWKQGLGYGYSSSDRCDLAALVDVVQMAHSEGLVVIEDSKLADIGSTNDAGMFYAKKKEMDAVTFSPFAGNMQEAAEQAHARNLGLISMCLMSNKEYKREKNKLVPIPEIINDKVNTYFDSDIQIIKGEAHLKQYIQLAYDAKRFGIDGIVVGAPSSKNHIKEEEIKNIRIYVGPEMLVLLPGVGAQGGEASAIWKYFDKNNVIVNVGRGLMFPNGSESNPQQQAEAAKQYQNMLNNLRAA